MKTLLLFIAIALSINVFGQSTVKIGNLEVMTENLEGSKDWFEAVKACADLGDGWRLPTKEELQMLYNNKDKIGGFASVGYWSSTESVSGRSAWWRIFGPAGYGGMSLSNKKLSMLGVRAVRSK